MTDQPAESTEQDQEELPAWAPADVDLDRPNTARIYDWYLGGDHNFAIDREFGHQAVRLLPHVKDVARNNRRFAVRAAQYALGNGMDQFLDLGSGIPTVSPIHELAHEQNPDARVVYVDHEAVAIAHGTALLDNVSNAAMVGGDFYRPNSILNSTAVSELIDFDRPVCLLLIALLHFAPPDKDQQAALNEYVKRLAPGSVIAISHATTDGLNLDDPVEAKIHDDTLAFCRSYQGTSTPRFVTRTKAEFAEFFTGMEMVEPGVDYTMSWHNPEITAQDHPARCVCLAGMGRTTP